MKSKRVELEEYTPISTTPPPCTPRSSPLPSVEEGEETREFCK